MTKDEALKMALNAMANKIESDYHGNPLTKYDEALQQAIDAGVEALATNKESSLVQPAQEPVGWIEPNEFGQTQFRFNPLNVYKFTPTIIKHEPISVYAHPAQPWQEVKDTIFSNYNENISKQVWNTKSGLEGTEFEITDDLK
jgi:hypothetical protein